MRASTFRSVAAFALIAVASVHAACTSPASTEGGLNYNAAAHEFEYCDNTNTWQSLGGGAGGGASGNASPPARWR